MSEQTLKRWGDEPGMKWIAHLPPGALAEAFLGGEWVKVDSVSWDVSQGMFKVRSWGDHYVRVPPELFRCQGLLFYEET